MKIAQVSPLTESVPPKCYGGTERIVSYLTEELTQQGHEVTLFASGDSKTNAHLIPACNKALRHDFSIDHNAFHMLLLEKVHWLSDNFDIIHFHTGYQHFPMSRRLHTGHITTHHGRLDFKEWQPLYREFREIPAVSISNDQRKPVPWLNWIDTVYNGVPEENYTFVDQPGHYLAFLGRISPEKRVDRAIEIASKAGIPIKIAAKIDPVDHEYYETHIKPLFNNSNVEFIGEINEHEKNEFLGNACGLLFPIDWPEPFGLVMIEAMACGTPVIAYKNGSVPEVMTNGKTGFVVQNIEQAVNAVGQLSDISRAKCRQIFEKRFSAKRMATDYLHVYDEILNQRHKRRLAG